ncbi:MAG: ComEC/Rec2 family competence protein [Propionibacteriaceae bacterium]|nr:ComEC/Rec2 family competence protein [Propionibacteriaceae bacterium]
MDTFRRRQSVERRLSQCESFKGWPGDKTEGVQAKTAGEPDGAARDSQPSRPDLRLVAPAVSVWVGMWLVTGWDWGIWAVATACGLSGVAALIMMWMRRLRRWSNPPIAIVFMVAVMVGSCGLVAGVRVASLERGPLAQAADNRSIAEVEVVVQTSRLSPTWGMAVVNATCQKGTFGDGTFSMQLPVVVLVSSKYAGQWLAYPAGSVVTVTVRLSPAEMGDGTAAALSPVGDSRLVRGPPTWQRLIESMRTGLSSAMRHSPAEQAALVPGLVVGDTSAMPQNLTADFRTTGLTHLTAVSGANLAILLSFLSVVARLCGVRGKWLTLVSVVGVGFFVVLCHSEPSVLRAAAMGIVSLVAVGRGSGPGSGISGICVAVMGLCWIDPWMSRSIGFILSVLACLGIIVWGRRWTMTLARWLPEWVAETMAIPLAAQVATQPVICALSGAVSVSGLAANAAAGPWVGPATVIGLVAALISPVSPTIASWAGYVAGWCAEPILIVGHQLASLPGASHPWPTTPLGLCVVVVVCVVVAAMLVAPFQPGWPGQSWGVAACDVGQGDAMAVQTADHQAIVLDVGPTGSSVVNCLNQLGVRQIPLLVLTHFHADHAGAFREVVGSFAVGSLLVPLSGGDGSAVLGMAQSMGIPVSVGRTGSVTGIGAARVSVVSAWQSDGVTADGEESSAQNDESLIVRVDLPAMSVLVTGDVEVAGQQAALSNKEALRVDILKVPHHGSARQDPDFLEATQARIALVSVGKDNTYGHPAQKTVKELVNDSMEVVRTDEHGSITISHQGKWSVTTQK